MLPSEWQQPICYRTNNWNMPLILLSNHMLKPMLANVNFHLELLNEITGPVTTLVVILSETPHPREKR